MTVRVTFLGSGNAFADGGRSNACIHVGAPGVSLLLDCGGSALPAIKRAMDPVTVDGIAVTHLHGDHFGGIPYLVIEQHFAGRDRELVVSGPAGLAARVAMAELALYPDFFTKTEVRFPVRTEILSEKETRVGGAMVSAFPVQHVPTSEPHGLRVRAVGTLIAYSGDATWSEDLVRLAKGADLFICDSSFFDTQDDAHVSYRTLMAHRGELDCGRIVLTHLGAETLAHLNELELEYAVDGTTVDL